MNILLTGGTGFIGSHLLKKLLDERHTVALLKQPASSTWRIESLLPQVDVIDYTSSDSIKSVFQKKQIECVMHLAGKYLKQNTPQDEEKLIESNVTFPSQMLHEAIEHKVKYFINTGTFFEYAPSQTPITEDSPLQPFNFYADTKLRFEKILRSQAQSGAIKAVTLKLFSPYGEMDNDKIIPLLIKSFLKGTPLLLTKGEQQLSFTYVEDIVEAYLKVLEFFPQMQSQYEAFNIGSTELHSIKDIVEKLRAITGKDNQNIQLGAVPYGQNELMLVACDAQKADKLLGWKAQTSLEDGLQKTYDYFRSSI